MILTVAYAKVTDHITPMSSPCRCCLLFQALMPFGFPAPPLISRPGETYNANLYVVAVNHWYMAMALKGMTADDLQLVPAFVAFAEDSWGIPITNRLGINVSNSALH